MYLSILYILLVDIEDMDLFQKLPFNRSASESAILTFISVQIFVILICYKIYMESISKDRIE